MIDLRKTDTGIYYFHNYIPYKKFRYYSEEDVQISKKIWAYKDGDWDALNLFTNELMEAVTIISKRTPSDKIGLVAVPPSKIGKESAVRNSIWNMEQWYKEGVAKEEFGFNKRLYNYGRLLTRTEDITTSHTERRATYEEQVQSISCSTDRLYKYWTTFVIIDDVTTTETSMNACRDIMIEHGAKNNYIYRLAIARTV